jgi:tetratricopeptide (TPR) repeat protein
MRFSVYKILRRALLVLPFCVFTAFAMSNSSPEAVRWLSKALNAYDRQDFGAAKTSLAMALEAQPNFSEAYLLKGMLEYHDGLVDKANASWQRALQLDPQLPEEMRNRLEERAHGIESTLTQQDFSHFHLQFHGAEQREKAWQAVKELDAAYNQLGSRFGVFPEEKFTVIIFTSDEFWEAWNAPGWLGGFFDNRDGRIRIRMDPLPGGDEEYRTRLRHEFTHAFIHHLFPKELPIWFQEGAAQFYAYNDGSTFWKDNRLDYLKKATKNAPWLDLARLEQVIKKKDAQPGLIYLSYLEAEALVLYVAKQRGDSWIPSLVERLRGGASFEDAFQQVVGVAPGEMLEQARRTIA